MRKSVSGWIPDWFPKVEKEESRKWEPVDGIQEKITDGQTIISFSRIWPSVKIFSFTMLSSLSPEVNGFVLLVLEDDSVSCRFLSLGP